MWEHLNHKEQQESWCKRKKVLTRGRFESSGEGCSGKSADLWGGRKVCRGQEEMQREAEDEQKVELSKTQQNNGEEKEQHVVWGCRVL